MLLSEVGQSVLQELIEVNVLEIIDVSKRGVEAGTAVRTRVEPGDGFGSCIVYLSV